MKSVRVDLRRLLPAFTVVLCLASTASNGIAVPATALVIGHGHRYLELNANGAAVAWAEPLEQVMAPREASAGDIRYRGETLPLEKPEVVRARDRLELTYRWPAEPGLEVSIRHRTVQDLGAFLWIREVRVRTRQKLTADLTVSLPSWPEHLTSDAWLPLINGTGADLGTNTAAVFRFAGASPGNGPLLALPLVSIPLPGKSARRMIATDPYFSTRFQSGAVEWTYLAKAGLGEEPRNIVVATHPGSVDDSIGWFYRGVLPEIAPGPAWLHQIALVDFDYLSDHTPKTTRTALKYDVPLLERQ
ncbi:MAG: hypothetical protein KGS61_04590 [Verrucomicrobia bacterium]|nr:hypothetical protein [Verrucomicrobiota bacterium]